MARIASDRSTLLNHFQSIARWSPSGAVNERGRSTCRVLDDFGAAAGEVWRSVLLALPALGDGVSICHRAAYFSAAVIVDLTGCCTAISPNLAARCCTRSRKRRFRAFISYIASLIYGVGDPKPSVRACSATIFGEQMNLSDTRRAGAAVVVVSPVPLATERDCAQVSRCIWIAAEALCMTISMATLPSAKR